jgi:hypothetical protein
MAPKTDDSTRFPIFFNECEKHAAQESRLERIESTVTTINRAQLQDQREVAARFDRFDAKIDKQHERVTGEIVGLREAVTRALVEGARHTALEQGIEFGKAEVTGEIKTEVRRWVKVAKWIGGAVAALAGGAGATEGLRRLLGG